MEWSDTGIVLSARRHGESAAVVSLLTEHHGRHAGLVQGARGRRGRGLYEPGNTLAARWQARLAEHLGRYTCELVRAQSSVLLDDPPRLAALAAVCALTEATLAERHPYPQVYRALGHLLDALEANERWAETVVRWELVLLGELGFGLDLSACAATGAVEGLAYVSPRSGRAVSREAGAPYVEKLLPLPPFPCTVRGRHRLCHCRRHRRGPQADRLVPGETRVRRPGRPHAARQGALHRSPADWRDLVAGCAGEARIINGMLPVL